MNSQRQLETGTAQVHGRLGAELLQLLPQGRTVYLTGWPLAYHAEVTGTSEEQSPLPQFGIAVSQVGDRHGNGVAAGSQSLRGGPEWEYSLAGAEDTQDGLP